MVLSKIENAAPIFESCVFDSNYANGQVVVPSMLAAGHAMLYRDTLWIRNSTFKNNWVDDTGVQLVVVA